MSSVMPHLQSISRRAAQEGPPDRSGRGRPAPWLMTSGAQISSAYTTSVSSDHFRPPPSSLLAQRQLPFQPQPCGADIVMRMVSSDAPFPTIVQTSQYRGLHGVIPKTPSCRRADHPAPFSAQNTADALPRSTSADAFQGFFVRPREPCAAHKNAPLFSGANGESSVKRSTTSDAFLGHRVPAPRACRPRVNPPPYSYVDDGVIPRSTSSDSFVALPLQRRREPFKEPINPPPFG